MILEWLGYGFAALWSFGGVIMFTFFGAPAIMNNSDVKEVTPHTVDCLRMLGPTYLGIGILALCGLLYSAANVRLVISYVLCATYAANVLLEIQWLISKRWKRSIYFYICGDLLVLVSQVWLVVRYLI